jgi:hypothetical protein
MRHNFLFKQTGTYCIHPNSPATTVNLKTKTSVRLDILVSCRKYNVVLIIRVLDHIKRNFSVYCVALLSHNLEVPGSNVGQCVGNAELRFY